MEQCGVRVLKKWQIVEDGRAEASIINQKWQTTERRYEMHRKSWQTWVNASYMNGKKNMNKTSQNIISIHIWMFTFRKTVLQLDPTVQSRKIIRGHTGWGVMTWQRKEDFANTSSNTKACMYCIVLQVPRGRNVITDSARQKATTGKCYSGKRINTKIAPKIRMELWDGRDMFFFSPLLSVLSFYRFVFLFLSCVWQTWQEPLSLPERTKNNKALLATQHFSFDRRRIN